MKSNKPYSIKRQLTLSVGLLVSALMLLSLYFNFQSAKHEVEEVYDARLGQSAKLLLLTLSISSTDDAALANYKTHFDHWMNNINQISNATADDDQPTAFGHPYEQNLVFQFYQQGQLTWSSVSDLPPLSDASSNIGYSDLIKAGEQWRTFQVSMPNSESLNQYVVVAEKQKIREEIIHEIALSTAVEQLLLLPALLLLLIWLINQYFRPISEMRSAIAQRNLHRLDRIYISKNTTELAPLVEALNSLLAELEQAWQREKRFTRTAAHELKTPLTILRLNAENALKSNDPEQLREDLANILQGIDRTDRLIHQLLTLAKVDSIGAPAFERVELSAILKAVVSDLVPLALKQDQDISLNAEEVSCLGDKLLLEVLFRNLIDNAIRYSGKQSTICVDATHEHHSIRVSVSDSGPTIPEAIRARIFEQFYRGASQVGDGAGLGMSICKDITSLHGASIEVTAKEGEMNCFIVRFPITNR